MPDYYNKAFQGGPKIGSKPQTEFNLKGPMGSMAKFAEKSPMGSVIGPMAGKVMGKMNSFASKIPGIGGMLGGMFGSEDKPSAKEMLLYHYGKVGQLQARAEAETDPRKLEKLTKKLNANKGAVEKFAYKMDRKSRKGGAFLPPRTFDEINSSRQAFMEKMQAGPETTKRTILRSL